MLSLLATLALTAIPSVLLGAFIYVRGNKFVRGWEVIGVTTLVLFLLFAPFVIFVWLAPERLPTMTITIEGMAGEILILVTRALMSVPYVLPTILAGGALGFFGAWMLHGVFADSSSLGGKASADAIERMDEARDF